MKKITGLWWAGAIILALGISITGSGGEAWAASQKKSPALNCSIKVPSPEPKDLSPMAKIKASEALDAAKKVYPGIAVSKVELDNENGCLVYSVELRNGDEILVDAGNGAVLRREPANSEREKHEADEKD